MMPIYRLHGSEFTVDEPRDLPEAYPPVFGDDATKAKWLSQCRAMSMTTPHRFTVAPRCYVTTTRGRLGAGERITSSDVQGPGNLLRLVSRGCVLENPSGSWNDEPPRAA
jgi:hypothetical protein